MIRWGNIILYGVLRKLGILPESGPITSLLIVLIIGLWPAVPDIMNLVPAAPLPQNSNSSSTDLSPLGPASNITPPDLPRCPN
jgi:hypothetical protein